MIIFLQDYALFLNTKFMFKKLLTIKIYYL